jgi:PPOX class probable F420-dependent enzyme
MSTPDSFSALQGHNFMSLTTFRKTGVGVATPVWFVDVGGKLYVLTGLTSGKIKRIRNNPCVTVAPSSYNGKVLGQPVDARARILPPEDFDMVNCALNRKYGWQKRLFELTRVFRRSSEEPVCLEITLP